MQYRFTQTILHSLKVINEVIAENKANGNIDKWVDEMTKKAVENAKK